MVCVACRRWSGRALCSACRIGLGPGPERLLSFGIARSGFIHEGAARTLVHRLKYEAVVAAGQILAAEAMAHLLPHDARALVPIPRTRWRTIRYGVDAAAVLADQLSGLTGVPALTVLTPALYGRRHAGRVLSQREVPMFGLAGRVPAGAVLVDDVLTTGSTLEAAAATLGGNVSAAITATVSV